MHISFLVAGLAIGASASPVLKRQDVNESVDSGLSTVDAMWDGYANRVSTPHLRFADIARECFYPESDDDFDLEDYLGRWYQVAGTVAPFTEGCTCIFAEYSLNVWKHEGRSTTILTVTGGKQHRQRLQRVSARRSEHRNSRECRRCRRSVRRRRRVPCPIPRTATAGVPWAKLHCSRLASPQRYS